MCFHSRQPTVSGLHGSNRAGAKWPARCLEPYGYRVYPMPMQTDHIAFWGGDIRCSTLPLVRDAA